MSATVGPGRGIVSHAALVVAARRYLPFLTVPLAVSFDLTPVGAQEAGAESELVPIGRGRISAVYDLDAAPPYAYALERQNLRVLDVRDPADVREVANLEFEGPRVRSALYGSHLYLTGFDQPVATVDVSEPRDPRWLGELPAVDRTISARIVGGILWVVRNPPDLTLEALDLRIDPARPQRLASLDLEVDAAPWPWAIGISHDGGRLFILIAERAASRNQIVAVDARDPRSPKIEYRTPLPEERRFNDLEVRGNLCYLITWAPDGLAVYRLRGADPPELLGSVTDPRLWYGADMILRDDVIHASFKGEINLATFDVADPSRPKLAHAFAPEGWRAAGLGFSLAGDRLYLSGDPGPGAILDVGDPREPRYLGKWDYLGGWAGDVLELERDVVAILNRWFGVYLYDVANPRQPERLARHYDSSFERVTVAAHRDRVLVSYDSLPAELLDVGDPTSPTVRRRIEVSGVVTAAALTARHAVLGYLDGGLEVIPLANDEMHVAFTLLGEVTDLAASGDRAVAIDATGSVAVLELGGPEGPRVVSRVDGDPEIPASTDGHMPAAAISDDGELITTIREAGAREKEKLILTLYRAGGESGLERLGRLGLDHGDAYMSPIVVSSDEALVGLSRELVRVDVSDPRRPRVLERHRLKTSMDVEGLARSGNLVYVGAAEDGLLIFELPQ